MGNSPSFDGEGFLFDSEGISLNTSIDMDDRLSFPIPKQRKLLPIIENYSNNREQTMQATLTSRRDHNFRVQTGKID